MISKDLQDIYNNYLYSLKSHQNKPFSARKNFEDFDDKNIENTKNLMRIRSMLNRFPHINIKMYFDAPFKVHKEEKYFGLDYFASMKAIGDYRIYSKIRELEDPDSNEQIEFLLKSIKFIASFCLKNKLKLEDYIEYKTGVTYDWMIHYKNREISIYSLMEFPNTYDKLSKVDNDIKGFLVSNLSDDFLKFKIRYNNSIKAKMILKKGLKIIKKHLTPLK
jgi:hypothetical protein